MQIPFGNFLFNKRATATTAKDIPALPINNENEKWKPDAAKEEAFPNFIIPIKYSAQKHVNMCGDACVNMLFAAANKPLPADLKVNPRGAFEGQNHKDISETYGGGGLTRWRPDWAEASTGGKSIGALTPMRLAYGLAHKGPLMMSGNYARFIGMRHGHWIVVHGIAEENVYIADPWHGENRHKPFSWLMQHADKGVDQLPFYAY